MEYPKIYLALDNCFAIKRWVEPKTWGHLIKEIGFTSVEASFDNEIDMLYNTQEYKEEWLKQLEQVEKEEGIHVRSFYTGYQTYRTAGLSHPNEKVVNNLVDGWLKPAIDIMAKRNNSMGFALHSIPEDVMQNPEEYRKYHEKLYQTYSDIGAYAKEKGGVKVCIEAMYSPQHTPWTIEGTKEFLKGIYAVAQNPMYTTVDIGHMTGQCKFRRPDRDTLVKALIQAQKEQNTDTSLWLGSNSAYDMWEKMVQKKEDVETSIDLLEAEMDKYAYQFSFDERDSDLYAWVEELACYSPIMHIQQTDGITSPHAPFTKKNNEKGIVDGKKLLEAMKKSYDNAAEEGMPPKVDSIVMALELFASNTDHPRDIKRNMKETREYWDQFIPEDGIRLDVLLEKLN